LRKIGIPIIVSIASEDTPEEFIELTRHLEKIKEVAAIELNISCPNIKPQATLPAGRQASHRLQAKICSLQPAACSRLISQDPKATYEVVKSVRKVTNKTLITKLSPNVTDITEIALAAEAAGSDCIALVNTITGMCVDIETRRPKIAAATGGLSGPAIRPVAIRMIWEVYQKVKVPIIGMGGIIDTPSALEFIIAGATAISIGTANFINPKVSVEIIEGIKKYLVKNKIKDIRGLVGSLKT
jgi:dihydroorotate dehydrogenase (NAD+) catalytic subunit